MSKIIVLDTHIWLWYVNQNLDLIPNAWKEQIDKADEVGVSSVSCVEIALAAKRGRLLLPSPAIEWFDMALMSAGIGLFALTPNIAMRAVDLSPIHKDPFDRIIIATALEYQGLLASVDGNIAKYPEIANHLLSKVKSKSKREKNN